jgi:hypothetical protein
VAIVHRRVILKPDGLTADQRGRLADQLRAAIELQQRAFAHSPHVLQLTGELQENDRAFFIAHEPAQPVLGNELYDPATPLPDEDEILRLTAALLDALGAAVGVEGGPPGVHGGLCPGVVLRAPVGVEKISDFGFARAVCAALDVDSYQNLAVSPRAEGDDAVLGTGVWEILPPEEDQRDDRLCSFIDPEKYLSGTLNTFESGSDIIAAGFLLHLFAEHKHPYLWADTGEARRIVELCQFTMPTVLYNGARRPDLRESTNPAIKTWCALMVTMLANIPRERPSVPEALKEIRAHVKPPDAGELLAGRLQALLKRVREKPPTDGAEWGEVSGEAAAIERSEGASADTVAQARTLQRAAEANSCLLQAQALLAGEDWARAKDVVDRVAHIEALPDELARNAKNMAQIVERNLTAREALQRFEDRLEEMPAAEPVQVVEFIEQRIASVESLPPDEQLVPVVRAARTALRERMEERLAAAKEEAERDKADRQRAHEWLARMSEALDRLDLDGFGTVLDDAPDIGRWRAQSAEQIDGLKERRAQYETALDWIGQARGWVEAEDWEAARRSLVDDKPRIEHWPAAVADEADQLTAKVETELKRRDDERRAHAYIDALGPPVDAKQWSEADRLLRERPADVEYWPAEVLEREKAYRRTIVEGLKALEADRRQAQAWIAPAQKAAADGQWDKVHEVLEHRPALDHWPEEVLIAADHLSATAWLESLRGLLDEERLDEFDKRIPARPELAHWPEDFPSRLEELETARAEHAAAEAWVASIRGAVEKERWEKAEALLADKPDLGYWPRHIREEVSALAERVRKARKKQADHAAAHEWLDALKTTVDAAEPDWEKASEILAGQPDIEHWPAEVLEEEPAYRKRVEEALKDLRKGREWWDKARKAAQGEKWEEATALLDHPPAIRHWPKGVAEEADGLRVTVWHDRCLAALEDGALDAFDALFDAIVEIEPQRRRIETLREELRARRDDCVAARLWLDEFRAAIEAKQWEQAQTLLADKPTLTYCPANLKKEGERLAESLHQVSADHAEAREWFERLRHAVDVDEPNWRQAADIFAQRPKLDYWPEDVLTKEPAYKKRVEEGIAALGWIQQVETTAQEERWADAIFLLDHPPKSEREDPGVSRRAEAMRQRCTTELRNVVRREATAFVTGLLAADYAKLLDAELLQVDTDGVEFVVEEAVLHGSATLQVNLVERVTPPEGAPTSAGFEFAIEKGKFRIEDEGGKLQRRLAKHFGKVLARLQKERLSGLIAPLSKGMFPKARLEVRLDGPAERGAAALKVFGAAQKESPLETEIAWDRSQLRWAYADPAALTRRLAEIAAIAVEGGILESVLGQSSAVADYRSICTLEVRPAPTQPLDAIPASVTLEGRLTLKPVDGDAEYALPAFPVTCEEVGRIASRIDMQPVEAGLSELVLRAQNATREVIAQTLRERIKAASVRIKCTPLPARITEPSSEVVFQLAPKRASGVELKAVWHPERLAYQLSPDWEADLEEIIKGAPPARGLKDLPWAVVGACVAVVAVAYGGWTMFGGSGNRPATPPPTEQNLRRLAENIYDTVAEVVPPVAESLTSFPVTVDTGDGGTYELTYTVPGFTSRTASLQHQAQTQTYDISETGQDEVVAFAAEAVREFTDGPQVLIQGEVERVVGESPLAGFVASSTVRTSLSHFAWDLAGDDGWRTTTNVAASVGEAASAGPIELQLVLKEDKVGFGASQSDFLEAVSAGLGPTLVRLQNDSLQTRLREGRARLEPCGATVTPAVEQITEPAAIISFVLNIRGEDAPRELQTGWSPENLRYDAPAWPDRVDALQITAKDLEDLSGEVRGILAAVGPLAAFPEALRVELDTSTDQRQSIAILVTSFGPEKASPAYDENDRAWHLTDADRDALETFADRLAREFSDGPAALIADAVARAARRDPLMAYLDPASATAEVPAVAWSLADEGRWQATTEVTVRIGQKASTEPLSVELAIAEGKVMFGPEHEDVSEALYLAMEQELIGLQNASRDALLREGGAELRRRGGVVTPPSPRVDQLEDAVTFTVEFAAEAATYPVEARWNGETLEYKRSSPWYEPPSLPRITRRDVDRAVAEIRAILAGLASPLAEHDEAVRVERDATTDEVPSITFSVPGFGQREVPLEFDEDERAWGIAEGGRADVEALGSRIAEEFAAGPERLVSQGLEQAVTRTPLPAFLDTEAITAVPAEVSWQPLPEGEGWGGKASVTVRVSEEALADPLEALLELEDGQTRFAAEPTAFVEALYLSLQEFLLAEQNDSLQRLSQALRDRLEPLGAVVAAGKESVSQPEEAVTHEISSPAEPQVHSVEARWNRLTRAYEPTVPWSEALAPAVVVLDVLRSLNEDRVAYAWLDAVPEVGEFVRLEESTDLALRVAAAAPWAGQPPAPVTELPASDRLALQVDVSGLTEKVGENLRVEAKALRDALLEPEYWPLVGGYLRLRDGRQQLSVFDERQVMMHAVVLQKGGTDHCEDLTQYLYSADTMREIVPLIQFSEREVKIDLEPEVRMTVGCKLVWELSPEEGALGIDDLSEAQREALAKLRPIEGVLVLVRSPAGEAVIDTGPEFDGLLKRLCATFPQARDLNELLTKGDPSFLLEERLRSDWLAGADELPLSPEDALAVLSDVWTAKGAQTDAESLDALTGLLARELIEKTRGRGVNMDRVRPTIFCEYFLGREDIYAIVWSAEPDGVLSEGPILLRLGPKPEFTPDNANLGELLFGKVFAKVPQAIRARRFEKNLGIVLALDSSIPYDKLENMRFTPQSSSPRFMDEVSGRGEARVSWAKIASLEVELSGYQCAAWWGSSLADPSGFR